MTNNKDDFELCLRVENVQLPTEGHFGVSAATGGLAGQYTQLAFIVQTLIVFRISTELLSTEWVLLLF